MFSLKHKRKELGSTKSKGFTIVELLIVIVVIGILATLVIVTFAGIQKKARDSQRQTDIQAVDAQVEAFYTNYGFYPNLVDINTASFRTAYLKGLDPEALKDPKASSGNMAATTTANTYVYATNAGCSTTVASTITNGDPQDNGCTSFTLTATLESGSTYSKASN